ncbi:MAG: hypothetical protein LBD28_01745 [Tannerellaceae bacterium]|jgi:hypothetical protein|nr:hypothetical protein [Tannerellaceae bacterium]
MKQTFVYEEKFAFSTFYPALVFIALTILFALFKYGLAIKNLTLLSYPTSVYVFAVCALGCTAYAFLKYKRAKESRQNPSPIEADEQSFSFAIAKGRVSVNYVDVKELWHKNETDEEQIVIYTMGNDRYQFTSERFASKEAFAQFEEILVERCTNIVNR